MARFKPKIPSRLGLLDPKAAERAVLEAGEEAAHRIADRITDQLRGWRHRPQFSVRRHGYTWQVTTDDEIFVYQDEGTDGPYTIRPRRKRALFWKGARHPVRRVRHPGLKPQDFTGKAVQGGQNDFRELLEDELRAIQRTAR
jgi:hypothetical protein